MGTSVIVIFGAAVRRDGRPSTTLRRRVVAAASFGKGRDALYVPTGGVGHFGPAEADVMTGLLTSLGVPRAAILPERTGRDTLTSALACAALLRRIGHAGPVVAMSSAYHLPRCVVLLRLAGTRALAGPPPPYPAARSFWLRWYWRLREGVALPYDVLAMLWRRAVSERIRPVRPTPDRPPRHARRRRRGRRRHSSGRA